MSENDAINAFDGPMHKLHVLRAEQDLVDREIMKAIAKRVALRRKISRFRIANELSTIDASRMMDVLDQAEKYAREENVPPEMGRQVFKLLIDWSHKMDMHWRHDPDFLESEE